VSSFDVGSATGGTDGTDAAAAIAPADAVAAAVAPSSGVALDRLPVLGSIGAAVTRAHDTPSVPRALLESAPGRSLAVVLALLGAILLFLAIHRRVDRGDQKLVAAGTGPDLARFR
jgi:hypothetical protein